MTTQFSEMGPLTVYTVDVVIASPREGVITSRTVRRQVASRIDVLKATAVLAVNMVRFELELPEAIWSIEIIDQQTITEAEPIPDDCYLDPFEGT